LLLLSLIPNKFPILGTILQIQIATENSDSLRCCESNAETHVRRTQFQIGKVHASVVHLTKLVLQFLVFNVTRFPSGSRKVLIHYQLKQTVMALLHSLVLRIQNTMMRQILMKSI